ncbi:SusC/RagA family TonB-linked outer membrane protein [Parapedobacter sp. DT-150]|uniref:SusC/RagA family TonB-linked outer membrane protein n=1 Tax=Parapedobacter sp. DT-150 TaxID=3396162 RepID=UPI003F1B850E
MKNTALFLITFCLSVLCVCGANATGFHQVDTITVEGQVTGLEGPLMGVSVLQEGTDYGTKTNEEGRFSIKVPGNSNLIFSSVGYLSQTISVEYRVLIDVRLEPGDQALDEVVVVAFGKQKKKELVGASTTISPSELKVPSSNLTTALAGRLAGMVAYQRSGEPGSDNAEFFIRGVTTFGYKKDPLILIDNVEVTPTDLARMQPDDIASFTIMKDATSTSLYGARGANGVILITTKEGKEGAAKVSFRLEQSRSTNTRQIDLADPITYMKLSNEAVLTRNPIGRLPYSQNRIDATAAGVNPYLYPANDWMEQLLNKTALTQRANLNVSGGGKVARYFIAGSYNQDNGILKVDKRNNFNNNINLQNFQLRSNVNINMTSTTEAIVRLSGVFDDYNGPIDGGAGMFRKIISSNPVQFPAFYPSSALSSARHILFGNSSESPTGGGTSGIPSANYINPYADMVKGYKDYTRSQMYAQFELKQNLGFVVPGLSARMLFNTSRYSYFDVSRAYSPFFYNANPIDQSHSQYRLSLLNEASARDYLDYSEGEKEIRTITYYEVAVDYNRAFGDHTISGLLVGIRRNQLLANQGTLQKSLPYRNEGVSGRLNYGYKSRYLVEFNFGLNGSERFYRSQRYGFFPSAGLAWNVSSEPFWEPLKDAVSELKVRATYGLVGNDAIGSADDRFFYLSEINADNVDRAMYFGTLYNYGRPGFTVSRYANNDITWEAARKLNLGVDVQAFNAFTFTADFFTESRSNILMTRSYIPSTMGLAASVRANVGEAKAYGVDASLDYNKAFGSNWWLQGRLNFTYAHSEYLYYEEPEYPDNLKHLSRNGQPLNQTWGYIAERLFIDEYDVVNSPRQNFGEYGAGDIKYHDVNGDNEITELDRVPIGFPTVPEIIIGQGLSIGYKALDFSFFFQGSARSSFWIDPVRTAPFVPNPDLGNGSQNALLQVYADDYWSEDSRNSYALWPRLSSTQSNNNSQTSTWFMRNGSFLRLKSVELGYSIPSRLLDRIQLDGMRIYLSGTNLLSFSGFKLWDIEMGGQGLGYPIQRVFNAGININL